MVTVFAGAPVRAAGPWDRLTTGRSSAHEAVLVRREEDGDALRHLGARPVWLDLLDGQYEVDTERDRRPIVEALARALDALGARAVVAPVGLGHPDHVAVADACLALAASRAEDFYLYLDMPYAAARPAQRADRLDQLGPALEALAPFDPVDPARKQRAVAAYTSQAPWVQRMAGFDASMTEQERLWRVA